MKKPRAKKNAVNIVQHGKTRIDNYSWLKDENWKEIISGNLKFKNPEILNYIENENEYKDFSMLNYKDIESKLYKEILCRIKEDETSFPEKRNNYYYYSREEKASNYSLLCRKKDNLDSKEEVYFDVNKEANGHELYIFGPCLTSDDNNYLIYFYNLTGSMQKTLKIRNLKTGNDLDWCIENCTGSFEWIDNDSFYYVLRDSSSRGKYVYKLNIQDGPLEQKLIYEKPERYDHTFLGLSCTNDHKYFLITLNSDASQILYLSKYKTDHFHFFINGENDITFNIEHYDNCFYILTNMNGANDFKIMKSSVERKNWNSTKWDLFLEETKDECIDDFEIYNKYMVITKKNNKKALNELLILDIKTSEKKNVEIESVAYNLEFNGAWDFNSRTVTFLIDSPIKAEEIFELDLPSGKFLKKYEKKIPNFDSSKYIVKRVMVKARDNSQIPLTILHKKALVLDGKNKTLIYGYGSYGLGITADFDSSLFSLIDRGFIYCIAHIRGGDDKGFDWYLNGKMKYKLNTFYDFIDCCEFLIESKYTSKKLIAINGASAGGLLIGAVTNMRPDLFGCVIADVAFVDVVNTISDPSLPLTPPEWEEWGNPIESKSDFEYMMKYSPYDNIIAQNYPPTLYNSGISDEQVTYWEPTKMVAKLRELKIDNNLLLLNMKMHAGHAGASKKYEWIEDRAFNFSFILKSFNMT